MTKILFINRVYPPVHGATGQLLSELAPALAAQGFDVTVLTTGLRLPLSPRPPVPQSQFTEHVRIERVPSLPFQGGGIFWRALAYLALYPALLWRALRLPRCDVLVTMTDPPLLLLLGPLIAMIKGCRLVHWAQDIYPELAERLGVLSYHGWIANLLRSLSTAALRKQSAIIALGRCMKQRLLDRGLPEALINVVPNWALDGVSCQLPVASCVESFPTDNKQLTTDNGQPTTDQFRTDHGLTGKFVVMYSGNFGRAHSFDAAIEAAQALQPKRSDIVFLMIGDGPRLKSLKAQVAKLNLSNVQFLPSQPLQQLCTVLSAADVHIVTMLPQTRGLIVPSKVYGILAAGRPCLFVGPAKSEAALLIHEYRCGEVISSGSALAGSILHLAEHPDQLRSASERAKKAATTCTLQAAATEFSRILRECVEGRGVHTGSPAEGLVRSNFTKASARPRVEVA